MVQICTFGSTSKSCDLNFTVPMLTFSGSPLISYDSVTEDEDRVAKIKNLTMFYEDLNNNALPQWMFITPNMTSNGHDSSVTVAGEWSKNFLEPLLRSHNFMNNTLVLLSASLFDFVKSFN